MSFCLIHSLKRDVTEHYTTPSLSLSLQHAAISLPHCFTIIDFLHRSWRKSRTGFSHCIWVMLQWWMHNMQNIISTSSVVEDLRDHRIEDLPRADAPISLSLFCYVGVFIMLDTSMKFNITEHIISSMWNRPDTHPRLKRWKNVPESKGFVPCSSYNCLQKKIKEKDGIS